MDEMPIAFLVEDGEELGFVWEKLFRSIGMQLKYFPDGESMLAALQSDQPVDLLVTDYHLPDVDGLTLIDKARKHLGTRLPCIVVSGNIAIRESTEQLENATFLAKPVKFRTLKAAIEKMLP